MKKNRRGIQLIAEMADVSIGTVDRALHGRAGINELTRQRILQIAQQISYTPNLAARAVASALLRPPCADTSSAPSTCSTLRVCQASPEAGDSASGTATSAGLVLTGHSPSRQAATWSLAED